MNIKQWAEILNGREYGNETTSEEESRLKEHGIVVVFGYSDDNAELKGAIDDEIGCYDGGDIYILDGELADNEECDCKYFKKALEKALKIKAVWCGEDKPCWSYITDIPHEKFVIYEDDEPYCEGIIFKLES